MIIYSIKRLIYVSIRQEILHLQSLGKSIMQDTGTNVHRVPLLILRSRSGGLLYLRYELNMLTYVRVICE